MLIETITLCNFKNFIGKQTIDFSLNNSLGGNIILISGANGAGKTTLLEAIKICLYGKQLAGNALSKNNYQQYILSLKNKESVKINDPKFYVRLALFMNESTPTYKLTLIRHWDLSNDKVEETFQVLQDGTPIEIIPHEYWQDYILSLIPPYISEYFFFDGERVKELAVGNNAGKMLKDSIRDIVGLALYEILSSDLFKITKKIKKKNIREKEGYEAHNEKEKEVQLLIKELDELDNKLIRNGDEINKLLTEKKDAEMKLKRTAGAYASERKRNEIIQFKTKEHLNSVEEQIKQICGDILPFTISSKLNKDLINQLNKERKNKEKISNINLLRETQQKIVKRLDKSNSFSDIPKSKRDIIINELNSIFVDIINETESYSLIDTIHNLSPSAVDSIFHFLNDIEKDMQNKLMIFLKKRERDLLNIKKINNKLNQVPEEFYVKEYIDDIASIQVEVENLEKENIKIEENKVSKTTLIEKIKEEILKLEEMIVYLEEDNKKINLASKIQKIIKEYNASMISLEIDNLETFISKMYNQLANKNDMVKEIKIEKNTLKTNLYDYSGNLFEKEYISAGEKEIYALSVLWGLSKISNKKLPIIIDSPLAKLDSTHVRNIISEFFPNAAEQVIILLHDREIDKDGYSKLKPYINKEYTLSLSNKDKIKKGYFPEKFKDVNKIKIIKRNIRAT